MSLACFSFFIPSFRSRHLVSCGCSFFRRRKFCSLSEENQTQNEIAKKDHFVASSQRIQLHSVLERIQSDPQVHSKVKRVVQDFLHNIDTHQFFIKSLPKADPRDVFVNGELDLRNLDAFGFDYDYTLASYSDDLLSFLFKSVIEYMVKIQRYPRELLEAKYDHEFSIRGIHYDIAKGTFLKLDNLGFIQKETIFRGKTKLSKQERWDLYPSCAVFEKDLDDLRQLGDIFCRTEACLISAVVQLFDDKKICFDPEHIYEDINSALGFIHRSGILHSEIISNPPKYIQKKVKIRELLKVLKGAGKKVFLLTNSPFHFVNEGMNFLFQNNDPNHEEHWTKYFDIVISSANKPQFYTRNRPFRRMNPRTGRVYWETVNSLTPGGFYVDGSLTQLAKLTQWRNRVIYFGDHLFNDLQEPSRLEGWKTGVVIDELETEVEIQNSLKYRTKLGEIGEVEMLMQKIMFYSLEEQGSATLILKEHRNNLRKEMKEMFNKNFGSVFRTHKNPTWFAYYLQRYADVYTSNIDNFLRYPMHYIFSPERSFLPHEAKVLKSSELPIFPRAP